MTDDGRFNDNADVPGLALEGAIGLTMRSTAWKCLKCGCAVRSKHLISRPRSCARCADKRLAACGRTEGDGPR